jgi:hypothetical protein
MVIETTHICSKLINGIQPLKITHMLEPIIISSGPIQIGIKPNINIMTNKFETELEYIMDQIGNSINLCLEYSNTQINDNTKNPFSVVMKQYELYKALSKAEEIYYSDMEGYEDAPFTPIEFNEYYRMLNRSVKDIMKQKQPVEVINEL